MSEILSTQPPAQPAAQPEVPSPDAAPSHEGFERVRQLLLQRGHEHPPRWLDVAARTSQEAADALGVSLGQIAKSVVFRRRADESAVLVIAAGDGRVDERKLQAHTGPLGRADAEFVKSRTGFSIGGVSPLGFAPASGLPMPQLFMDASLFRFDCIWAAAGHPNGVFPMTPQQLQQLTDAAVIEVVQ